MFKPTLPLVGGTVLNSEFDGGLSASTVLVDMTTTVLTSVGDLTFQYNYVHNYTQVLSAPSGVVDDRFNLFDNFVLTNPTQATNGSGATHMNFLQWGAVTTASVRFEYNAIRQALLGGAEGLQFYPNTPGGTLTSATVIGNTVVATKPAGFAPTARADNTAYSVGAYITVTGSQLDYYICQQAGTTSNTGSPPAGYTSSSFPSGVLITDGTAKFYGVVGYQFSNVFHGIGHVAGPPDITLSGPGLVNDNYFAIVTTGGQPAQTVLGGAYYSGTWQGFTAARNKNMIDGSALNTLP